MESPVPERTHALLRKPVSGVRKLGLFLPKEKKPACKPKPYRQMPYPGRQIRVDVKAAPRHCIAAPEMRLYQHTAIDGLFIGHLFAADHLFLR